MHIINVFYDTIDYNDNSKAVEVLGGYNVLNKYHVAHVLKLNNNFNTTTIDSQYPSFSTGTDHIISQKCGLYEGIPDNVINDLYGIDIMST